MTAATIKVRIPSGAARTWIAESVRAEFGLVTSSGQWANRPYNPGTRTWSAGQIVEVRYVA
jgi:hypothetical protein